MSERDSPRTGKARLRRHRFSHPRRSKLSGSRIWKACTSNRPLPPWAYRGRPSGESPGGPGERSPRPWFSGCRSPSVPATLDPPTGRPADARAAEGFRKRHTAPSTRAKAARAVPETEKTERKVAMRIACPVSTDEGVGSRMHEHFGSAPGFVVIDSVSMETTYIPNPNREHGHGMCSPLGAFTGNPPDAVAVVGIGAGALGKLAASGIDVYMVSVATAGEAVQMVTSGKAVKAGPGSACAGHGHHGGGCSGRS